MELPEGVIQEDLVTAAIMICQALHVATGSSQALAVAVKTAKASAAAALDGDEGAKADVNLAYARAQQYWKGARDSRLLQEQQERGLN